MAHSLTQFPSQTPHKTFHVSNRGVAIRWLDRKRENREYLAAIPILHPRCGNSPGTQPNMTFCIAAVAMEPSAWLYM